VLIRQEVVIINNVIFNLILSTVMKQIQTLLSYNIIYHHNKQMVSSTCIIHLANQSINNWQKMFSGNTDKYMHMHPY